MDHANVVSCAASIAFWHHFPLRTKHWEEACITSIQNLAQCGYDGWCTREVQRLQDMSKEEERGKSNSGSRNMYPPLTCI